MKPNPLLLLALLLGGGAASQSTIREARVKDALLAAYRRHPGLATGKIVSRQQGRFLLLASDAEPKLLDVLSERAKAFVALDRCFEKHYAEALKLAAPTRPMPVWVLGDRGRFRDLVGPVPRYAHFDAEARHAVLLHSERSWREDAVDAQLHEIARLVLHARMPGATQPFAQSAWLEHGLAAFLAQRPQGFAIDREQPVFRYPDEARMRKLAPGLLHPPSKGALRADHNPLDIRRFADLTRYLDACGLANSKRKRIRSQLHYYRDAAFAWTCYLELAFRGCHRETYLKRLGQAMRGESLPPLPLYGKDTAEALPVLLIAFCGRPHSLIATPREKVQFARIKQWLVQLRGGLRFVDHWLAEPEEHAGGGLRAEASDREAWLRTRVTSAIRRMDTGELDTLFENASVEDPQLEALARSLQAMKKRLFEAVADDSAELKIAHPVPGKRGMRLWDLSLGAGAGELVLRRDGVAETRDWRKLQPHLLAEALAKADRVDDEIRPALSELVRAQLRAAENTREERDIRRRARKAKLDLEGAGTSVAAGADECAAALAGAKRSLLAGDALASVTAKAGTALRLAKLPAPLARAAIAEWIEDCCEVGYGWIGALHGRGHIDVNGVLTIQYDWSDPEQARDWCILDPARDLFAFSSESKGAVRLEVDAKKKHASLIGVGSARHRVQFDGDLLVRFSHSIDERPVNGTPVRSAVAEGLWLLNARSHVTGIAAQSSGHGVDSMRELRIGKTLRRAKYPLNQRGLIHEWLLQGQKTCFERRGTEFFAHIGEAKFLRFDAPNIPRGGAIVWTQPYPRGLEIPKTVRVGPLELRGKPDPESVRALRQVLRRRLEEWARRTVRFE